MSAIAIDKDLDLFFSLQNMFICSRTLFVFDSEQMRLVSYSASQTIVHKSSPSLLHC